MDVSSATTSVQAALTAKASSVQTKPDYYCEDCTGPKSSNDDGEVRQSSALDVFRQELGFRLLERFGVTLTSRSAVFEGVRSAVDSEGVAREALALLSRVGGESPDQAGAIVTGVQDDIAAAQAAATSVAGSADEQADIDRAAFSIQDGLKALEDYAASNVPAEAAVVSVDSQVRERSTIRIRTQEGDVVRLNILNRENLSVTDASVSADGAFASETAIEYSSDSRLRLTVRGDLNDDELAAIRTVFEQAEQIAAEFFDGDFAAAFEAASALQYDAEQLARVNLRFRSRTVTSLTAVQAALAPPVTAPDDTPALAEPVAAVLPVLRQAPANSPQTAPVDVSSAAAAVNEAPAVAEAPAPIPAPADVPAPAAPAPADLSQALDSFFDRLGDFLRGVSEGFAGDGNAGVRYHYSESFKLELLKSVITVAAPEGGELQAAGAANLIDQLTAAKGAETRPVQGDV